MSKPRPKIVVASTYPFDPPLHGGQRRACSLYGEIARFADVEVVAMTEERLPSRRVTEFGFLQTSVPPSAAHQSADSQLGSRVGFAVGDIAFSELVTHTPAFTDALARSLSSADLAFCCQPYVYPSIRSVWNGPIVYDSQNVETLLKQIVLPQTPIGAELLNRTCALERDCLTNSALVGVMSSADADLFVSAFAVPPEKIVTVPPGMRAEPFQFRTAAQRLFAREAAGLRGPVALFVGSDHPPNNRAVRVIYQVAQMLPDVTFMIAGGACRELTSVTLPRNVHALGKLSQHELERFFSLADMALNPCSALSGINMKMYDYILRGLPVIAHPNGIRGTGLKHGDHVLIADDHELREAITSVVSDPAGAESRAVAAYGHLLSTCNPTATMATLEARLGALLQTAACV